ncbi:hypothetical protein VE01_06689 [Pseudogymnoascus verrucosus]|uniref:Uncharacterized protein n=1 Tax=Pseudogymnoascus verrucosus TaxID=342668 RepID=A0A1B8GJJ3_9PEZI|nr:uncharacterized protein VE01_06689 [Pseudogymnoascus verrucosus]OBT95966.1 hypothetical protein VE01_06689 [Pseudogymnoascus verrucosus]
MTLNLKHIKRSRGKSKKKKFTFYEGEDLSCCVVSFMLALALTNNAFKNKFKSLRDIYNLVVPLDANRITLKWDDEWAERPVFYDVKVTANGVYALTPKERRHIMGNSRDVYKRYYMLDFVDKDC